MNPANKPIANPDILLRVEFDDWAVLFDPISSDVIGINPVGVLLWEKMDGQRDLADLVAEVKKEFAEVPDTVEADISALIDQLEERGYIGYEVKA